MFYVQAAIACSNRRQGALGVPTVWNLLYGPLASQALLDVQVLEVFTIPKAHTSNSNEGIFRNSPSTLLLKIKGYGSRVC